MAARGGQHQVAEAGEPHEGLRARAERAAEPHHLREPARDQRGAGAFAERAAGDDSRRDGEHVFDRAAELDSDQVVARIRAEHVGGERRRKRMRESEIGRRDGDGGRKAACNLISKAGTRKHRGG